MKCSMPILTITLAAGCVVSAGGGAEVELRTAKSHQVVFEPPDLRLMLVNRGSEPMTVAVPSLQATRLRIERDGNWTDCRNSLSITPGVGPSEVRTVPSGGEFDLGPLQFSCPGLGESSNAKFRDWTEVPGRYRLQAEYHPASPTEDKTTMAGASATAMTSNAVVIEVTKAEGVDAEALAWMMENHLNPQGVEVANRFPSSTYAAIVLSRYVSPALPEPERVKTLIAAGTFPGERSVPSANAPEGWIKLAGRELASWQIETGERILGQQPGFAYSRRLRLAIALAYASVGKKEQGERGLRALEKDRSSAEGQWAARYLALGS